MAHFRFLLLFLMVCSCSNGLVSGERSEPSIFAGKPPDPNLPEGYATVGLAVSFGLAQCSAVLIHPRIALTAKHCGVIMRDAWAFFGANSFQARSGEAGKIAQFIAHDSTDLAMIILEAEVPATLRRPVALFPSGAQLTPGEQVVEAGYGDVEQGLRGTLLRVDATYVETNPDPRDTDAAVYQGPWLVLQGMGGGGACFGDSGGPAYVKRGDTWYVIGVTSSGTDGSCRGEKVFYTPVQNHLDWIRQTAAANGVNLDAGPTPPPNPDPSPTREPSDISNHALATEVRKALAHGLIRSYRDNSFRPDANITRLETALLLREIVQHTRAGGLLPLPSVVSAPPYPDVPVDDPFVRIVAFAKERNLLSAFADGTFQSNASIQRGYFLAALYKSIKEILVSLNQQWPVPTGEPPETFADVSPGHWTEGYAKALSGFCRSAFGTSPGILAADSPTSRAYAAVAAVRAFECLLQRVPQARVGF